MKKFNITTVGSYTKNGEEKKTYPQVGKLIKFDATAEKPESYLIELNMFPNTRFCVFEDKPKEAQKVEPKENLETIEHSEEPLNPEDIPFN